MTTDTPNNAEFLWQPFATEQECLLANLKSSNRITHPGDRGEVNEQHFIDFLRKYLPNRYTVQKGIILDFEGSVSHSIDVVVFDRQHTPTLLDNDKHRYIPAEAVYAIFECKPKIDKGYLEYAADKAASVRKLKRTSVDIYTADRKIPAKQHFEIVAGILAIEVDWTEGSAARRFATSTKASPERERLIAALLQKARASTPSRKPEPTPLDRRTTLWRFSRSACCRSSNPSQPRPLWIGRSTQINSAT